MSQIDPTKLDRLSLTSKDYLNLLTGLSREDLVEELASLFFKIDDIAVMAGMPAEKLRNIINFEPESGISRAYKKGTMKSQIMLRFDTMKFAMTGSPQAESEMNEFLSDQKLNENA